MAAKDRTIDSLRDLQRLVPAIVKEINADERLALRAAANPLLALEELGYRLTPEVRTEAERRIRFAPQTIERLSQLSEAIYSYADERFDIESPAEIERILFEKLKLPRLDAKEQAPPKAPRKRPVQQPEPTLALQPSPSYLRRPFADPLERLRGAHRLWNRCWNIANSRRANRAWRRASCTSASSAATLHSRSPVFAPV